MKWLQGFLSNDSLFGRMMTRCGVLIAANLLFLVFSAPLVTVGASWTALYDTLFRTLRAGMEPPNPFRVFWAAFRSNFKQATIAWLLLLALAGILALERFWCGQFTGPVALFRYPLSALLAMELVLAVYLFPTMAAFRATLAQLLQDCVFFAVRRPLNLLAILFLHVVPLLLTYADAQRLPFYAFLWCLCGFSGLAMCCGRLLLQQYGPYLSAPEAASPRTDERSQQELLEDMRKLGM